MAKGAPRSRARFPIAAKILLWFFLNLAIIAGAGWAFLQFEFHVGPETLLSGRASQRVRALAALVEDELAAAPAGQWSAVLARTGNLYGLQLAVFEADGRQLAGEPVVLPREVRAELFGPRPPPPPPPPPMPHGGAPGDGRGPELAAPLDGPPGGAPLPERPRPPRRGDDHRMLHTREPGMYWLLTPLEPRLAKPDPAAPAAPGPGRPPPHPRMTLVAMSKSLGLGGLVLDPAPWLLGLAVIVVFSVLFWLPLVGGMTASIRAVTHATAEIAQGRFDARVRADRRDELGQLAQSVNQMAERLAGFVHGQKRFLGDIAHELCSPIARTQMALGILEQKLGGTGAAALGDLREEVQEMSALVNELLLFSKASLAVGDVKISTVPLERLVKRVAAREGLGGIEIKQSIPEGLLVRAEPGLLERALSNLVRNAVKYASDAGPIEIEAQRTAAESVVIIVSDHGPGVPVEALAQVFDPFFRVDISRARETGGAGLGLAIVKTCIESCGGRVACRNRLPHGLIVSITLQAE